MNKFKFNFNILKVGFWCTVFLIILKLYNVININIWVAFLPLFIALGTVFILIFLIGLITLMLMNKELDNQEVDGVDSEEETDIKE